MEPLLAHAEAKRRPVRQPRRTGDDEPGVALVVVFAWAGAAGVGPGDRHALAGGVVCGVAVDADGHCKNEKTEATSTRIFIKIRDAPSWTSIWSRRNFITSSASLTKTPPARAACVVD